MKPWNVVFGFAVLTAAPLLAETGAAMWLRYAPVKDPGGVPGALIVASEGPLVDIARAELERGVRGLLGRTLQEASGALRDDLFVIGLTSDVAARLGGLPLPVAQVSGAFALKTVRTQDGRSFVLIAGEDAPGVLNGVFTYLRLLGTGESMSHLNERGTPWAPIRWVNQWDNLDGSIERGYGGRSIFWENGHARADLSRVREYARFLASLGLNACSIDNVNANPKLLTQEMFPDIASIANAMRTYGVRVALSVDFGSPQSAGGLDTFDPLDARVAAWWRDRVDALYAAVPDLAGFVMKADSEGRAGPSKYNRTHADAANVVARALAQHHGLLFYRGFVYNHHMDWRDPHNDRAKAAYDNFVPLDGKFDSNVVVQIKNGPIDFQVREPASPLFGALEHTNQALELQVTQEYMGQSRQMVYLAPQWQATLDFDEHAAPNQAAPVKSLAAGKVFGQPEGGFAGVVNVGLDANWMGSEMAQANLYAYGRLAWDPNLTPRQIAEEWTRLTWSNDPQVITTVTTMLMKSWRAYEEYTGPLGLQTLTDITGNHFGVNVEASERNGWGQWHNADAQGVGMDRSSATGTGYAAQYRESVAREFESAASTPDDLMLFFHHVPYQYKLHDGKTVIQTIYDDHYQGAETAAEFVTDWQSLNGKIDPERYREVLAQLEYQAGVAVVWRDAVNRYFARLSGIADDQRRVGNYPGRVEAEAMQLTGYRVTDVKPWEVASGGKAVVCSARECTAVYRFQGDPGVYDLRVEYFDPDNGAARFRVMVNGEQKAAWIADDHFPTNKLDGGSSARKTVSNLKLTPGETIAIEGTPDGGDPAAFDYIELIKTQRSLAK